MRRRNTATLKVVCPYCEAPQSVDCIEPVGYDELVECVACTGLFVVVFSVSVTVDTPRTVAGERERTEKRAAELDEIRRRFNARSGDLPGPRPGVLTSGASNEAAEISIAPPRLIRVDGREIPIVDENQPAPGPTAGAAPSPERTSTPPPAGESSGPKPAGVCSWDGCDRKPIARGLCSTHYPMRRAQLMAAGKWNPRAKGSPAAKPPPADDPPDPDPRDETPVLGNDPPPKLNERRPKLNERRRSRDDAPDLDLEPEDERARQRALDIENARDRTGRGYHRRPHPYRQFRPGWLSGDTEARDRALEELDANLDDDLDDDDD